MKKAALFFSLFVIAATNLRSQQSAMAADQLLIAGCSSFCLDNNGYAIFGANYDLVKNKHDGLVIVNQRNVSKTFQHQDSPGEHVRWTSRYGSVTFNFIASQTSWTGMNEAGLVIYSMRLEEGSKPPAPDQRQWLSAHYWLQYMLDNFSTIEEVLATDSTIRIVSSGRIPHYLVSDRYGNCVTIEFIDGKTVTHAGKNLLVKVLANTAYATSIAEWENITLLRKNRQPIPHTGTTSRGRFLRAVERVTAFQPTDSETAVKIAFDILKDISRANTNWSIVYDTKNLQIHFKTIVHSAIRMIDLQQLDFSCQSPVKMIDINERLSGDITDQLKDYSFEYHFDHALRATKKYGLEMTAEELKKYIRDIEEFPCHDHSKSESQYLGQKPPGDTAKPFAPAFFGSMFTLFHSGIVFSPDGNAAYWQAMLNDKSKGQAIFESRIENGYWTNPRVAPFSELVKGGRDDSPFITPDGERLFFLSSRPVEKGGEAGIERIWVVQRAGQGWSEPELVPLSWNPDDGRIHWRFSVDGKGNLYFGAWKIVGEEITGEIYHSRFENGEYDAPERLGPEINREGYYNFCPNIAPDGSYLIFTSVDSKVKDRLPDNFYCSFRGKDGKWTHAWKLQIPGDKGNDVPAISSDGKYLFMRHGLNQFYWVETSIIDKLRPKE